MSRPPIEIETGPNPTATVIVMHGLGADGNDFVPIANELDLSAVGPVRFVFPNAPVMPVTINGGYRDAGLVRHRRRRPGASARTRPACAARRPAIEALIANEKARGIPAGRIVVAGFSQGCAMALHDRAAPRRAAGGHRRPVGLPAAGRDRRPPSAMRPTSDTPIFLAHGQRDGVVPIGRAPRSARRAEGAGLRGRMARLPDGALGLHGGDRRPQRASCVRVLG